MASIKIKDLKAGFSYSCDHFPTNQTWHIIGINLITKKVCAAGFPPTIANLEDCFNFKNETLLTEKEIKYRNKEFGSGWI